MQQQSKQETNYKNHNVSPPLKPLNLACCEYQHKNTLISKKYGTYQACKIYFAMGQRIQGKFT